MEKLFEHIESPHNFLWENKDPFLAIYYSCLKFDPRYATEINVVLFHLYKRSIVTLTILDQS